jgi:FixJ family two-component response regulator
MFSQKYIFVIDRDPQLRAQIQQLSSEADANERFYDDAESFLEQYGGERQACIVAELQLEGMTGLSLQQELRRRSIPLSLVFVSHQPRTADVVRAVQQGAVMVLDKPACAGDLLAAIEVGLARAKTLLRVDSHHALVRDRLSRLTLKEQQVLDLVMAGKPNKVIARRLGVSLRTVEVRRQNIFRKTETRSVAELVQMVITSRGRSEPVPEPDGELVT